MKRKHPVQLGCFFGQIASYWKTGTAGSQVSYTGGTWESAKASNEAPSLGNNGAVGATHTSAFTFTAYI